MPCWLATLPLPHNCCCIACIPVYQRHGAAAPAAGTLGGSILQGRLHVWSAFLPAPPCCRAPARLRAAEETYKWLVQLPVAAISLDFLGVPGA